MSKISIYNIIIVVLIFSAFTAVSQEEVNIEKPKELVRNLQTGDVEKVYQEFDSAMTNLLSPARLSPIWKQLTANYGEFNGFGLQDTTTMGENLVVNTDLNFAKAIMNLMVSYNSNTGKVSGLYISQEKVIEQEEKIEKKLPEYIDTTSFFEEKLIIKDLFDVSAKLSIPNNYNSGIVFVLVPGSGPNDMDGTAGENKFLQNLAWGLASKGYATLRYDKLTYKYGRDISKKYPKFTQEDEYNNTILKAIAFLKEHSKTKKSNIVLIGHSQGASVVTSFSENKDVSGLILLAGSPRKLYNLYVEQLQYIFNLDGVLNPSERTIIKQTEDKIAYYKSNINREVPADSLPLDLSYQYLKSLDNFDPIKNLSLTDVPVLIVNGKYDYQATLEDYKLWESNLEDNNKIDFEVIDANHIFAPKNEMSVPADYKVYTPITPKLFDTIVNWISKVK